MSAPFPLALLATVAHAATLRPVGLPSVDAFFKEVEGVASQVELAETHVETGRERASDGDGDGVVAAVRGARAALLLALPRVPGLVQAALAVPAELADETALLQIPIWKMPAAVRNLTRNVIETARLPSRLKVVISDTRALLGGVGGDDTLAAELAELGTRGAAARFAPAADATPTPAWAHHLDGPRPGMVHVGDAGIVVASSPRGMLAADIETGELLWRRDDAPPMKAINGETAGYPHFLYSTCAEPKRGCTWHMLDLLTGEARWSRPMADGRITLLAGTATALLSPWKPTDSRPLEALDPATGAVRWSDDTLRAAPLGMLDPRELDAALAGLAPTHVLQCEAAWVGLRDVRDGHLRWTWTSGGPLRCETARLVGDLLLVQSQDGVLHVVDGQTGEGRWALSPEGRDPTASGRVTGDALVVAWHGAKRTTIRTHARLDGAPRGSAVTHEGVTGFVRHDDRLFVHAPDWTVAVVDGMTGGHTEVADAGTNRSAPMADAIAVDDRLVLRGPADVVAVDPRSGSVVWAQQVKATKPVTAADVMMAPSQKLGMMIGRKIAEGFANPASPRQQGAYLFQRNWKLHGRMWMPTVLCIDAHTGERAGEVLVTGDLWPYRVDDLGDAIVAFQYKNPTMGTGGVQVLRQACGAPPPE